VTPGDDSELGRGIFVSPRDGDSSTYDAHLDAGWRIGSGVNGGLLLAVIGNALRARFAALPGGHVHPVAVSGYYLSTGRPGPATVRTRVLRSGASMSSAAASLVQPGAPDDGEADRERVTALATYADLATLPVDVRTTAVAPDLPPPDRCVSVADTSPDFLQEAALLERLDLRLDPACLGWMHGRPSGQGVVSGWLRMADGREPDALLLLLAVDALPPVTFDLGLFGWTPTLELTVHVRATPAPGWLRVRHATRNFAGGLLEEDAEVWDSTCRLVAQSRQLALAPRT
jgi:hypothetical protein